MLIKPLSRFKNEKEMMRIPGHLSRWSAVLCAVVAANVAALDNGLGLTPPMGW
jgi:hypothetical protein